MGFNTNLIQLKNLLYLLLPVLLLVSGCMITPEYKAAELKTINDVDGKKRYRSKVLVVPVINRTRSVESALVAGFQETFIKEIKGEFKRGLITLPNSAEYDAVLKAFQSHAKGSTTETFLETVKMGGYQAIATASFTDIQTESEDTGIWWFKDNQHSAVMRISAEVIDTGTGARLATYDSLIQIEIEDQVAAMIKKHQVVNIPGLDEEIEDAAEDLGNDIGEILADMKWRGTVIGESNGTPAFAPGGEAGIAKGDRFYIFDGSRRITGGDGISYVVPGYKTGEVTAETVFPDSVEMSLESGASPKTGDFVLPAK